ncbi:hypothetical protein BJX99DRAFT_259302 [Aspergillus californicus]
MNQMIETINIYDTKQFPTFYNLPNHISILNSRGARRTNLNWCFVCEVVFIETTANYHTEVTVKDLMGRFGKVVFSCPYGRTAIFDRSRIQIGSTIFALSATMRDLNGGGKGIWVEQAKMIKILPRSLADIARIANEMRVFTSKAHGGIPCYECGYFPQFLTPCPQCQAVYFCHGGCPPWAHIIHIHDCRVLADKGVVALLRGDWDSLRRFQDFSFALGWTGV